MESHWYGSLQNGLSLGDGGMFCFIASLTVDFFTSYMSYGVYKSLQGFLYRCLQHKVEYFPNRRRKIKLIQIQINTKLI